MILDYKDSAKIQELLGKRVLITKFSTSLVDPNHKNGRDLNSPATLTKGNYITITFDKPTNVPGYNYGRTSMCLSWIECELDPDGNY